MFPLQIINYNTPGSPSIKDWLPLLSIGLTLGIFVYDRMLAARIRHREVHRNWYLKVLVEPNLARINEFYSNIEGSFEEAARVLSGAVNLSHQEYRSLKLHQNERFTDAKRLLEANLLYPLRPQFPLLVEGVDQLFISLFDEFTGRLDKEAFTNEDVKDFHTAARENKGQLLYLLYLPLTREARGRIEHIR